MKEEELNSEILKTWMIEEFLRELCERPPKVRTVTIKVTMEKEKLDKLKSELKKYGVSLNKLVAAILEEAVNALPLLEKFRIKKRNGKRAANLYLIRSAFSVGCHLYHALGENLDHMGIQEGLIIEELRWDDPNYIEFDFAPLAGYYDFLTEIALTLENFKIGLYVKSLLGFDDDYRGKEPFEDLKEKVESELEEEISLLLDDLTEYDVSPLDYENAIGVTFCGCDLEYEYFPHLSEIKKVIDKVYRKMKLNRKFRRIKFP